MKFISNMLSAFMNAFQSKLRIRIMVLLVIFALLPIFVLQIYSINTTYRYTHDKNEQIFDENLKLTNKLLNSKLSSYKDVYFTIATDPVVQSNMVSLNETDTESFQYRRIKDALDTAVISHILTYPEIQGVGIIGLNDASYFYVQKREKYAVVDRYFNTHYEDINQKYGGSYYYKAGFISPEDDCYDQNYPSFFIAGGCFHYEKMRIIGTLILFFNPEELNEILNDEDAAVYDYCSRVLLTSNNYILCDKTNSTGYRLSDVSVYERHYDPSSPTSFYENSQITADGISTDYLGLKVLSIVDYGKQNQSLKALWVTLMIVSLIIIIAITFVVYSILGEQVLKPVERISRTMNTVTDVHMGEPFSTYSKTELGIIEHTYNDIRERILQLLADNELQLQKTYEAELKSLELQINPHFIFNTLDTINWSAMQSGADNVSEMLTRLGSILRYTVYGINKNVPLQNDIDWIHQYLDLQKVRFHDKFDYDIFIASDIDGLYIHKLLLQPILENALIHGFDQMDRNGHIEIHYHVMQQKYLVIAITDNGTGIDAERLDTLRRLISNEDSYNHEATQSIGIANVIYRMREYYKHSKIQVSSGHRCTCFKLFIPISEMEKE